MPLAVPSGSAGTTPSLALSNSSQAGNWIVGVVWSLDVCRPLRVTRERPRTTTSSVESTMARMTAFAWMDGVWLQFQEVVIPTPTFDHNHLRGRQKKILFKTVCIELKYTFKRLKSVVVDKSK
jgi:hypothetical protein